MVRGIRRFWGFMLALLLLVAAAVPVQGAVRVEDRPAPSGTDDFVFVRFSDPPVAQYTGSIQGIAATKPAKGQKLDLQSDAARTYGNRLQAQRANYLRWLAKHHPQVEVVSEYAVTFNGLGLKLNGATLKQIQAGPGAVEAGQSALFRPAMNASHGVIQSAALWDALGGQANAGEGVKVGVIDTGIDHLHPFLQPNPGMTAPAGYPKGDTRFTSEKVIVARVFHQSPWMTPEDFNSHGTHVSGTIAGMAGTDAPLASGLSGVAPGAWLGNYNVFPGSSGSASSLFIAKAVEQAVIDGMDVLNLSLGGTAHQGADLLDMAVNAAAEAGVVVAIAAGNDGPGYYTVGSPGTASGVITVAAISNGHLFAGQMSSAALAEPVLATSGSGAGALVAPITGTYALWADQSGGDTMACAPIAGTPLLGQIALIQRGVCNFSDKINNAAAAGAVAVIIYQRDDVDGPPINMSTDGVTIPAVMIGRDHGYALSAWAGDRTVTIEPPAERPADAGLMADFTSWGPTPNYTLKPDLAAPGVGIYSSVVGGGFEVYQGTSMATPHVAGAAALLVAHGRANSLGWGPAEVKAALMGTARPGADTEDPLKVGAGIIDLERAMMPPAMALPSSLSFGLVRPVANQEYRMAFTLTNTTGMEQTYQLTAPAMLSLDQSEVTLGAGESAEIMVTVADRGSHSPGQGGTPEMRRGMILVDSAAGQVRLPFLYLIDYNR